MNNKRGFTLVEVLIATGIMAVVLGGLAYGLSQCASLSETAQNQDIALTAAQQKLEEIANDVENILTYNGQTFPVEDTGGSSLLIPPAGQNDPGQVSVTQVAGTADLFDVDVTIGWQQRNGREISRTVNTTLVQK